MGLTVLDAGVLIGFFDRNDVHHEAARKALGTSNQDGDDLTVPASAYAELLVGPSRRGPDAVAAIDHLLSRIPVTVVPVDPAIARTTARIRARHAGRMKLPDALVVATAVVLDADVLVSTDRKWPTRTALGLRARLIKI